MGRIAVVDFGFDAGEVPSVAQPPTNSHESKRAQPNAKG